MANKSVLELAVQTGQWDSGLKKAKSALDNFISAQGGLKAALDKDSESVTKFVRMLGTIDSTANSTKGQLRELTQTTADLTIAYRQLTDEEKNSPVGQAMQQSIQQLTERAGLMRDAMDDVNASIKNTASDTRMFDQIAGAATLATSSFQTLQGATKLLGIDMGDNVEILAKLQAAMAVTNGLTAIQTQLQKQSAVMQGIATIQTKALAAAKAMEAKGTAAATAAQRVFNAVANANPYVLLASAVIAVGTALVAFSKRSAEATETEKRQAEAAKELARRQNEAAKSIGSSVGNLVGKYQALQTQWNALRNDHERNKFIKENQTAFQQMGVSIKSLTDAENVFVNNSAAMVQALKSRAEAAAYEKILIDAITRKYENDHATDNEERLKTGRAYKKHVDPRTRVEGSAGSGGLRKEELAAGLTHDDIVWQNGTGDHEDWEFFFAYTEEGLRKINEYRKKVAQEIQRQDAQAIEDAQKAFDEASKRAMDAENDLRKVIRASENNNVNNKSEKVSAAAPLGSAKAYSEELQDLKRQQDLVTDPKQWKFLQNEINRVTAESKLLKGEWTDGLEVTFSLDESTGELEEQLNEINGAELDPKTLTITADTLEAYTAVQELVKDIEGTTVSFKVEVPDKKVATSTNVGTHISNLSKQQSSTAYGSEEFNTISAQLADANAYRNIIEKAIKEGIDTAQFDSQELWNKVLSPEGISDTEWQAIIDRLNEEIKKLNPDAIQLTLDVKTGELKEVKKTAEDTKNAWKGTVNAMQQVGGALEQIEDPAAKVAGIVMQAIANIALAFSKSSIKAAGGGPFAWIAATAAGLGTMLSTIAAIKSATKGYAEGGQIKGTQRSGDNVVGLLPSGDAVGLDVGEIILNRAQQGNLVSQMQNNSTSTSNSLPYVYGEQIVLGMNNYFKRIGRGEIVTTKRQ